MTKPRPWPTKALWAKDDALESAQKIDRLGAIAIEALENHNVYKSKAAIIEMRYEAKRIEAALLAVATEGEPADDTAEIAII